MIDEDGFRAGVGIVIINGQNKLLWAKRIGQPAWQFPQGGLQIGESPIEAMYRELREEVGLEEKDVQVLAEMPEWLSYRLPPRLVRQQSLPLCIGQKQKWFLLQFLGEDGCIQFDKTGSPEFDHWRWVAYWYPLKDVVNFKRNVYNRALHAFSSVVF